MAINKLNLHDGLPRYPPLNQLIRVTNATVPGPSYDLYVSFTQQQETTTLLPRDREPCLGNDVNQVGLTPGLYLGRLSGSYNGLPVYELTPGGGAGGSVGPRGPAGPAGSKGDPGTQGTTGATGSQGVPGTQGPVGSQGPPGTQGTQGIQGIQGPVGPAGSQGPPGTQGTTGQQGPPGPAGSSGGGGGNNIFANVVASGSTSSTSYVDLVPHDELIFTLTTASNVLIEYQCQIVLPSALVSPEVGYNRLIVNGATEGESSFESGLHASVLAGNLQRKIGLGAGSHTIEVEHKTFNGTSVTWQQRMLKATTDIP